MKKIITVILSLLLVAGLYACSVSSGGPKAISLDISDSKKNNAGIGLSVCASIIKAHGGDIKAENEKEGGCIFRFTLNMEDK